MKPVIAFDADDTLWSNEPYFRETEARFTELLEAYLPQHSVSRELLKVEIANLQWYGYGIKSFMLSMIETVVVVTGGNIPAGLIEQVLALGKEMLRKPVVVLAGVEEVLASLQDKYTLVVATKGDLLDQERKLRNSGLEKYFHHIEIMSEKAEADYEKLMRHLECAPANFMMVGNSIKSDILPVLNLGGHAVHIPFHVTWELEHVDVNIDHPNFRELTEIRELLAVI